MGCTHTFRSRPAPCPHAVRGESGRCLWHHPGVRKSDAYVRELLAQADAAAAGDLEETHLVGIDWPGAQLPGRNLRGADLRDARFDDADLAGCDLTDAVLRRASLRRADLRGAKLTGTDLTGASFAGADLRDADLQGATLDGTVLNGADLRGANLAGAKVVGFRWNRLTRFAGVRGLEARESSADQEAAVGEASTQRYITPIALGDHDLDSGQRAGLGDPDPDLERTRIFTIEPPTRPAMPAFNAASTVTSFPSPESSGTAAPETGSTETAAPAPTMPAPTLVRRRWPLAMAAASLVIAAAGLGVGAWDWRQSQTGAIIAPIPAAAPPMAGGGGDGAEIVSLRKQIEADLVEIRKLQERSRELADSAGLARQEAATRRAEAEAARAGLRESEQELMRLRDADDRATVAALRLDRLGELNRDLARTSSRQDHISRVLAEGVERLRVDNEALTRERDRLADESARHEALETETVRLRSELLAAQRERDSLQGLYQGASAELRKSEDAIGRYLARLNATRLQDYLGDGHRQAALLPVEAGKPIALSGDYLLTLRVDPGGEPRQLRAQVVVQRPAAAANPDVTLILYDRDEQPLRRLAFSFPHVDDGRPFVAVTSTIACDRFPAFARVLIAPGIEEVAARR